MFKNKYSDKKMSLYIELIHQYELELEEENREDFREFIEDQIKELESLKRYLENWTIGD